MQPTPGPPRDQPPVWVENEWLAHVSTPFHCATSLIARWADRAGTGCNGLAVPPGGRFTHVRGKVEHVSTFEAFGE
eukprot:126195-Chlamydomonas_euryale.AAC.2